jgi:hypothetical protein
MENDIALPKMGGSIATYATDSPTPQDPFLADGAQEYSRVLPRKYDFRKDAKC